MKRFLAIFMVLVVGLALVSADAFATGTTLPGKLTKVGSQSYLQFGPTTKMKATSDTLYMHWTAQVRDDADSLIGIVNIFTSCDTATTDSVHIGVRVQYSLDGTVWSTGVTLGTDSTSWATKNIGTNYKLTSFAIYKSSTGGARFPYNRLMFIPKTGNKAIRVKGLIR